MIGGLAFDVPVIPDGPTAQDWAQEELSKAIYHEGPSLMTLIMQWAQDLLIRLLNAAGEAGLPTWLLVFVVATAIALGAWKFVAVPLRRNQQRATAMFTDPARTAASFRAEADAASAAGRHADAVLARFRALVRDLEERAILDEAPGRTAYEAGVAGGQALPAHAVDLVNAARLFDRVAYGKVGAGPADDTWLADLDLAIHAARPVG